MKSQKPRPERWPLVAAACASNGRRLVASLCATQPANGRRLVADLLLACKADRPRVDSFLRRSLRRVDQVTWPARVTAPEQSFGLQPSQLRLQAFISVSATPSIEIAAALASTMAQRLLKVVTAVGPLPACASLKQSLRSPSARDRPSSTLKLWAQASAAATFTRQTLLRLNSLQLQRSASASDSIAAAVA